MVKLLHVGHSEFLWNLSTTFSTNRETLSKLIASYTRKENQMRKQHNKTRKPNCRSSTPPETNFHHRRSSSSPPESSISSSTPLFIIITVIHHHHHHRHSSSASSSSFAQSSSSSSLSFIIIITIQTQQIAKWWKQNRFELILCFENQTSNYNSF